VGLFPGKTLSNPYSGNLADLCPVGALTDRDFRFKCRVWYLRSEDSVCPGCSRGCNIRIDHNPDRPHHGGGRRVMRLKPRENPAVNQWWLCDEGRYGYKFIDERRILSPLRRRGEVLEAVSWEEALRELASSLETAGERKETDRVGIIPSTQMTNEDMFAVRLFFQERLGFSLIDYRVPVPDGEADEFLRTSDKSPNTRGAEEIFRKLPSRENELIFRARKGKMNVLIVFGYDLKEIYGEDTCRELKEKLGRFVFIGPNENGSLDYADLVLPSSVYAEKEGTFTNFQGRVQRLRRAFAPMGSARPEWEIAQSCVPASGGESVFRSAEEVFLKLAESTPGFSGLTYAKIGCSGAELSGKSHG